MAVAKLDTANVQKFSRRARGLSRTAAAEARQCRAQDRGIPGRGVELSDALFDLADDHVPNVGRNTERFIEHSGFTVVGCRGPGCRHEVLSPRKPEGQDVEIGPRSKLCVALRSRNTRDNRELGHSEVAVHSKICFYERHAGVHSTGPEDEVPRDESCANNRVRQPDA